MSEFREFLNRYNLGFNSYSQMIKVSRNTLMKYEVDPDSIGDEPRRKIEIGMLVLEREQHIRPKLKDIGDNISVYRGSHGLHFKNVIQYEKDFKAMFEDEMGKAIGDES